jgi:tetratricopeptide (TPR) repeat protein
MDVDSARVAGSWSETARSEDALIPTVGRIACKVRADLGERRGAIQATRELQEMITPSFEAAKRVLRSRDLMRRGEYRAAITVARSALVLDPDFALAWGTIGGCLVNLGQRDSAIAAVHQALARPARLTERYKLLYSAVALKASGDFAGGLATNERLVQLDPQFSAAQNNLAVSLLQAGRWAEAVECYKAAERLDPFGTNQLILGNQLSALLVLGRVSEARLLLPRLTGPAFSFAPMWVAAAAGEWSVAESLATVRRSSPISDPYDRADAGWTLAAVQSSRGQVLAAKQTLREAQAMAEADQEPGVATESWWRRAMLALCSRGIAADPGDPVGSDTTAAGLITRGVWAAATGDTTLARRLLIRTRPAPDLIWQGFAPAVLEAWIATRTGRWPDALRIIGPAAMQGEAPGNVFEAAPLVRWLAAEAYEHLDRPDSAAAYFERAIAPPPVGGSDLSMGRLAFSPGHCRLVLLYARMGRLEEAGRHWEILSESCTRPDPEMKLQIEEARAALANAEAVARSSRP